MAGETHSNTHVQAVSPTAAVVVCVEKSLCQSAGVVLLASTSTSNSNSLYTRSSKLRTGHRAPPLPATKTGASSSTVDKSAGGAVFVAFSETAPSDTRKGGVLSYLIAVGEYSWLNPVSPGRQVGRQAIETTFRVPSRCLSSWQG